jgi:hypothetical protein
MSGGRPHAGYSGRRRLVRPNHLIVHLSRKSYPGGYYQIKDNAAHGRVANKMIYLVFWWRQFDAYPLETSSLNHLLLQRLLIFDIIGLRGRRSPVSSSGRH